MISLWEEGIVKFIIKSILSFVKISSTDKACTLYFDEDLSADSLFKSAQAFILKLLKIFCDSK